MTQRTCVVTGGAGFIGSHLVDRLLADGHRVRVVDNLYCGRLSNLAAAHRKPNLSVEQFDVVEVERMRSVCAGADWVFHLAAMADIVPSIEKPVPYYHANVNGTLSVLEAAREAGVTRFFYAASSSCYGIPDVFPTPETAPLRPQYPYALTKMLGEQLVMHWAQVYGVPAVSLRFFNVYGPRVRTTGTYGAVFGVFLAQKLASKPLTVVGDGTQTRDFTYVGDVVDAIVTAVQSQVQGEIMNVGSGHTYSVNKLVALIGGEIVHIPKRPGEPDCTYADTTKILRLLGWTPKVSLEEGVASMMRHIEDWRDAPVWTPDSIERATASWFKYLGKG
jgi:UDP-glucose 4-epimerase